MSLEETHAVTGTYKCHRDSLRKGLYAGLWGAQCCPLEDYIQLLLATSSS